MIDSINAVDSENGSASSGVETSLIQPKNPEWDCLLLACKNGDAYAAKRILRENSSAKSHANIHGQNALHIAAWWNHVKCVEVLLQSGADVSATNSLTGATPLHECLQSNRVHRTKEKRRNRIECLNLLLQANAHPRALDGLGRIPLECFALADEDDVADYAEIEERIAASERATNNPVQVLLRKVISREYVLEEIENLWLETFVDNSDAKLTYELLSTEAISMTEAWIDAVERASEEGTELEVIGEHYNLGCTTLMWRKIFEMSNSIDIECKFDHLADSVLNSTLSRLIMALVGRYEYLRKLVKSPFNERTSLLQEDVTLSSWIDLTILLLERPRKTTNSNGTSEGRDWTKLDDIQQTWITIARRNYFDLAHLWWDRFNISPIGIRNRQGMTALQFAARSGHVRMVKWLIGHPSLSNDRATLLQWIESRDNRGQTALAAAKANQHDQILELLREFNLPFS